MEVSDRKERRCLMSSKEALDKKREHVGAAPYTSTVGIMLIKLDDHRSKSQFSKVPQVPRRLVTKIGRSIES